MTYALRILSGASAGLAFKFNRASVISLVEWVRAVQGREDSSDGAQHESLYG